MAHLVHILFVVFYRRTLLCLLALALAWDFYYVGPKDSVLLYGVLTLSERVLEGSKQFPDFMDQAYEAFRSFYEQVNDATAAFIGSYNETTPSSVASVNDEMVWALTMAGHRTGISSEYLTKVARLESGLITDAEKRDAMKAGLFLIDSETWVALIEEFGGSYGVGGYAHDIKCTSADDCVIGSDSRAKDILALRTDAVTATFMAAELTRKNRLVLESQLARNVNSQELYLAHRMGADESITFINALEEDPYVTASDLLPETARRNTELFFGPLGSQRTVNTINELLTAKWDACAKQSTQLAKAPAVHQIADNSL